MSNVLIGDGSWMRFSAATESTEGVTEKKARKRKTRRRKPSARKKVGGRPTAQLSFPKHNLSQCLRIPTAILEQNAGNACSDRDAARFAGVSYRGTIGVEISSALKYGLLERPAPKTVKPTDLTRRIQTSKAKRQNRRHAGGRTTRTADRRRV